MTKGTNFCKFNHPDNTETTTNRSRIEYEMSSFSDAIANELIRIRSDLLDIKVKQKDKGWECFPDEFLKIFWMYKSYNNSAVCQTYQTPDDKTGGIVILLDYCDLIGFENSSDGAEETLRKLNSQKENKILSGMELPVYIYDPEFPDLFNPSMPKILSITKNGYCATIVLEIDTMDDYWSTEKFTREIDIYRNVRFFISDEEYIQSLE